MQMVKLDIRFGTFSMSFQNMFVLLIPFVFDISIVWERREWEGKFCEEDIPRMIAAGR